MRFRRRNPELPDPTPGVFHVLANPENRSESTGIRSGQVVEHGAFREFSEADWPDRLVVNSTWVERMTALGLIAWDNPRLVHRSAGPPDSPWKRTHTFTHADRLGFVTERDSLYVISIVWYRVHENPDKWPVEKYGDVGHGGRVVWDYDLIRESDDG